MLSPFIKGFITSKLIDKLLEAGEIAYIPQLFSMYVQAEGTTLYTLNTVNKLIGQAHKLEPHMAMYLIWVLTHIIEDLTMLSDIFPEHAEKYFKIARDLVYEIKSRNELLGLLGEVYLSMSTVRELLRKS